MDERLDNSQQLMDILLVMDKEEKTIQAVSGVQDGKLQTKNPLEDNNDLLRVDRHGDMFSNFFSNLWNQIKDPTRFHFFRVPEEEVQRVAADFQQDRHAWHSTKYSRPNRHSNRANSRRNLPPGNNSNRPMQRNSNHNRRNSSNSRSTSTT